MEEIIIMIFVVGFISTQVPHTYKVFEALSRLEGTKKNMQAWSFSILTSGLIALFIYINNLWLAGVGVGLEIIINLYYFTNEYWESTYWGTRSKEGRVKPIFVWQYNFMKIIFSIFIPALIFILSWLLHSK